MLLPPPFGCPRTGFVNRPGTWRQRLRNDLVKQIRLDRRVRGRSDLDALLREILVGLRGERRGGAFAGLLDPGREGVLRQRLDLELHVSEAVAAEMARHAEERSGLIGAQVELRRRAVHRVDHAAELRYEESVQHARRRQREVNW